MTEIHSCDSRGTILSTSQLSLKAVHVLALALRASVVNVLDQWRVPPVSLSTIKNGCALVRSHARRWKKVAIMTERRLKSCNISETYNAWYRGKCFATETEAEELRKIASTPVRRRAQAGPVSRASVLIPTSEMKMKKNGFIWSSKFGRGVTHHLYTLVVKLVR